MTIISTYSKNHDLILAQAPVTEPERQYYFIDRCAEIVAEKEKSAGRKLTACINTFGCQMNAKDSEKLLGIMEKIGYTPTDSEAADFVLYNTCTVREHANVRVYGRLGVLKAQKDANPEMIVAMCGCMMQEPEVVEKIKKSYRHVNLMFGTHNIYKLAELLFLYYTTGKMQIDILQQPEKTVENLPSVLKHSFKTGINIMYGCDNFCSYCIVPYVRGRERSRRAQDILKEVRSLADSGVIEIMLLGQNVNSYGRNFIADDHAQIQPEDQLDFPSLLKEVEKIDGIKRIRFMTSHPKDLSDELIETIRNSNKICRHIHLPLQSGSTRILKEMNRKYTKEEYLALAAKIRERIPDVSITTDIIVGFPGETEEDFLETLDVVRKVRFDSAFTFIYSKRTGTRAASMPEQIDKNTAQDRFDRLLKLVTDISKEQTKQYAGRIMEVLVEDKNAKDPSMLSGRLSNNSVVHFKAPESLIGSIVQVKLDEACGFYYIGSLAE